MESNLLVLPIVMPLLAAFLLQPVAAQWPRQQRWISLVGPLLMVLSLLVTLPFAAVLESTPYTLQLGNFAAPTGITLYLDGLSWLLLVALQLGFLLLWPQGEEARHHALTLLLAASSMGMALSGDLFNLYVFYELMAVATFGLVASAESRASAVVGFRYLLLSGFGSVLALSGIALIYSYSGTLSLAHLAQLMDGGEMSLPLSAFLLILLGFGVKAELFALNSWVPEVYAVVSPRLSALLAGLVSKLAVVVIARVLLLLFPQQEATDAMLLFGILGAVTGELAAWRAQDLRRMLAYSSIGQLGMIFIAFSLSPELGMLVGIALSLHHLLVKPGLFLLLERPLSRWGMVLFVIFALSLVGVPPLPGFWAKLTLLSALVETGGWLNGVALSAFLFATVVEASYLFRVVGHYYHGRTTLPGMKVSGLSAVTRTTRPAGFEVSGMVAATLLAVVLLWSSWQIESVAEQLQQIALQAGDGEQLINVVLSPALEERP